MHEVYRQGHCSVQERLQTRKKTRLPINLLNNGILVLTLTRTGSHGDFFSKNILLLSKDSATGVLLLPVTLSFF